MADQTLALPFDIDRLIDICRRNGVSRVGIFGSFARGDARPDSDLDLLVEFSGRKGLLGVVALERELEAALGIGVDLLTEGAISPYLRDRVMRDLRVVYEAR
jgi:uncharacterized protein